MTEHGSDLAREQAARARTRWRGDRLEETKRRSYLAGVLIGLPLVISVGIANRDAEPLLLWFYPVLGLAMVLLGLGLWTRVCSPRTAERTILILLPAMWFARLGVLLYGGGSTEAIHDAVVESIGPGIVVVVLLIYLANDTRTGAWMSVSVLAAFGGLVAPWILLQGLGGGDRETALAIARTGVWATVIGGMAYVLASLKEQVAEHRARAEDLDRLARTDPLTGISNRRNAASTLHNRVAEADRYGQSLAVVVLDLDGFKLLNDTAGHAAGDQALRDVTKALEQDLRATDLLARWGGDELLVVAPHTSLEEARRSAERWRQRLVDLAIPAGPRYLSASVGVTVWAPGDTVDRLVQRADDAMYLAKARGGNRVVTRPLEVAAREPTTDLPYATIEIPDLLPDPDADPRDVGHAHH